MNQTFCAQINVPDMILTSPNQKQYQCYYLDTHEQYSRFKATVEQREFTVYLCKTFDPQILDNTDIQRATSFKRVANLIDRFELSEFIVLVYDYKYSDCNDLRMLDPIQTISQLINGLEEIHKSGLLHGSISAQFIQYRNNNKQNVIFTVPAYLPTHNYKCEIKKDFKDLGKLFYYLLMGKQYEETQDLSEVQEIQRGIITYMLTGDCQFDTIRTKLRLLQQFNLNSSKIFLDWAYSQMGQQISFSKDIACQLEKAYQKYIHKNGANPVHICKYIYGAEPNLYIDLKELKAINIKCGHQFKIYMPSEGLYLINGVKVSAEMNKYINQMVQNNQNQFKCYFIQYEVDFKTLKVVDIFGIKEYDLKIPHTQLSGLSESFRPLKIITQGIWKDQEQNCVKIQLQAESTEFKDIANNFYATSSHLTIIKINRIQNKLLFTNYKMEQAMMIERNKHRNIELTEKEKETLLWHGVKRQHPKIIYESQKEGFDPTYSEGGSWGFATYFASSSYYSLQFAYKQKPEDNDYIHGGVMLCCKVALGRSIQLAENHMLRRPPLIDEKQPELGTYDSVEGLRSIHVLYQMDVRRAYPAYEVIFK